MEKPSESILRNPLIIPFLIGKLLSLFPQGFYVKIREHRSILVPNICFGTIKFPFFLRNSHFQRLGVTPSDGLGQAGKSGNESKRIPGLQQQNPKVIPSYLWGKKIGLFSFLREVLVLCLRVECLDWEEN